MGPTTGRRQLICTSLAYVAQVHADGTLVGGGTVVLTPPGEPGDTLTVMEAERVTHTALVEPGLVELVDHPELLTRDLSDLAGVAHIGANAPASLRRRLLGRLGPRLVHPYGASECGLVSVLAGPDYTLARPHRLGTSGRILPGVEVRITDSDGGPASIGSPGPLIARTPYLIDGYVTPPPASGGVTDGWANTGDIGSVDSDGFLTVHGRAVDARTVGAKVVFPVAIEDVLCAHPDVRYAVALPDPQAARFAAAVVVAPGVSTRAAALSDYVQASDELPLGLVVEPVVVVERMPVTEQGTPDRSVLNSLLFGRP
jgi:fatty-acyl-CoA synthase